MKMKTKTKKGAASKGRVVLYMPHYVSPEWAQSSDYLAVPPLPFLALGRPLLEAGYEVQIVDAKWDTDWASRLPELLEDAVCFGVSGMTGYSLKDGLHASGLVKQHRPDLPVVWGGWHTSFVAPQAVLDPRIDVGMKGQAEHSFVEVLDALREKRSLREVRGIAFREGDQAVQTPDRLPMDVNDLPPPAYELVDVNRYIRRGPGTTVHANTILSRGCPYQCDFCLDSRKKWFGLSLARIEAELKFWVLQHDVNSLRFYDGNFFLGRDRLMEIARMITGGELRGRFTWTATGVASRLAQFDGELLDALREAGCRQIAIGAETGSDELLKQITNKTTVEQTTEAVRRLTRHGINQYLFFMVGYPDEPEGTLPATLQLVARLKAINPQLELQMNFCMPLPGSRMFEKAVEKGLFKEPRTFEDWGELDVARANVSHIAPSYEETVRRFLQYLLLAYPNRYHRDSALARLLQNPLGRIGYAPLRRAALWRVERQAFSFPLEARLYGALQSLRARRLAAASA
jgi:anaerobic magnesium-protoporphyrin IX monomethyl ester cyclase